MTRAKTPRIAMVQPAESAEVSLAIVMAHLGRWVPLSEIRKVLDSESMVRPLDQVAARADRWGLESERFEATLDSLAGQDGPLVLRWEPGRFVVLEGSDDKGWWIHDPKSGPVQVPSEEFAQKLPMDALALRPGKDFQAGGEAPSLRRSLERIVRGMRGAFVACSLAAIGLVLGNLALAGLLTYFMDQVLVDRIPSRIPPFLLALGVVCSFRAIFTYLQAQYSVRIQRATVLRLEVETLEHTARLPHWEVDVRAPGDVQQRLSMIRNLAPQNIEPLTLLPSNLATMLLFGVAILLISPLVALGVLLSIIAGFAIAQAASPYLFAANTAQQRALGLQRATMLSGLNAREWLAESGAYRPLTEQWMGELAAARNFAQENGRLQLLATTARGFSSQAANQVGTLVLGGIGVIQGTVTIGELAALQTLVANFQTATTAVINFAQSVPVLRSNLARVEDILDVPPHESTVVAESDAADDAPALSLRDVAFGDEKFVTGEIYPGTVNFIEGLSTADASSLALRLGGRRDGAGEVILRQPRMAEERDMSTPGVRLLVGDCPLHAGTVEENVAGFDARVEPERVWRALDEVRLGDRVRASELGLAGLAGEGDLFTTTSDAAGLELATALVDPPTVAVACGALGKVPLAVANQVLARLAEAGTAVLVLEGDSPLPADARRIPLQTAGSERTE